MTRFARPAIVGLFSRCGPTTIRGFIVAVVVVPLDRMFHAWTWPHIGHELLKRILPRGPYANASRSIVAVGLCSWIEATTLHRDPDRIFGWAMSFGRIAVAPVIWMVRFVASTGNRHAAFQMRDIHKSFCATFAPTQAIAIAVACERPRQDQPSPDVVAEFGICDCAWSTVHRVPKYSGYGLH